MAGRSASRPAPRAAPMRNPPQPGTFVICNNIINVLWHDIWFYFGVVAWVSWLKHCNIILWQKYAVTSVVFIICRRICKNLFYVVECIFSIHNQRHFLNCLFHSTGIEFISFQFMLKSESLFQFISFPVPNVTAENSFCSTPGSSSSPFSEWWWLHPWRNWVHNCSRWDSKLVLFWMFIYKQNPLSYWF